MRYTIRRAVPGEAGRLTALARDAKATWGYPPEWLDAWRDELTFTPAFVATRRVFVADAGDGPIGMVVVETDEEAAVIEHLWVARSRQGQGLGKALVRQALAEAAGAGRQVVRVTADPHAVPFYEARGGRVVGSEAAAMPGAPDRRLPILELTITAERDDREAGGSSLS